MNIANSLFNCEYCHKSFLSFGFCHFNWVFYLNSAFSYNYQNDSTYDTNEHERFNFLIFNALIFFNCRLFIAWSCVFNCQRFVFQGLLVSSFWRRLAWWQLQNFKCDMVKIHCFLQRIKWTNYQMIFLGGRLRQFDWGLSKVWHNYTKLL